MEETPSVKHAKQSGTGNTIKIIEKGLMKEIGNITKPTLRR